MKTVDWGGDANYKLDVYELTFEIIKDGKRLKQDLVLHMYANHDYERGAGTGDNALEKNQVYSIKFDQMSRHRGHVGWENTIRFNNAGVFAHPGDPVFNIGCKAICREDDVPFNRGNYDNTFEATQQGLQDIRDLYNITDQQGLFFITGRSMLDFQTINIIPIGISPTPIPKPQGGMINPRYF